VLNEAAVRLSAPRLSLKAGKSRLFWAGNPIVFGGSVQALSRPPPVTGDAVLVTDHSGSPIGWGAYNEHSLFRVRLLGSHSEAAAEPHLALDVLVTLRARLAAAVRTRSRLGLPSPQTDTYRLINSEGDKLSGLTADVFGDTLVVQCSALWLERRRDVVATELLAALPGVVRLLWRPMVDLLRKEDGVDPSAPPEQWAAPQPQLFRRSAAVGGCAEAAPAEDLPERMEVVENDVRYTVALGSGQKSGFYCDQRENRARVRSLAASAGTGARVLDLCCYSGGFAISAALGGAADVTGVDSSAAAVALARANSSLNGLDEARVRFVCGDVMETLQSLQEGGPVYDVVILDPPKLAPTRAMLARAASRYRKLNTLAAAIVRPGGTLVSCSCSGAMTQSGAFPSLVADSIAAAGRGSALTAHTGAAPCHVQCAGYAEGNYLTTLFFVIN
jgi:23S rRNA G2069 N7-methylase RlmK/C1962 C5-methylase RlmI